LVGFYQRVSPDYAEVRNQYSKQRSPALSQATPPCGVRTNDSCGDSTSGAYCISNSPPIKARSSPNRFSLFFSSALPQASRASASQISKMGETIRRVNGYDHNAYTYYPVIIVGAGASGIAAACRLKDKLGFDQFRVFDRQAGIGGTWWINRYPGVAW